MKSIPDVRSWTRSPTDRDWSGLKVKDGERSRGALVGLGFQIDGVCMSGEKRLQERRNV